MIWYIANTVVVWRQRCYGSLFFLYSYVRVGSSSHGKLLVPPRLPLLGNPRAPC